MRNSHVLFFTARIRARSYRDIIDTAPKKYVQSRACTIVLYFLQYSKWFSHQTMRKRTTDVENAVSFHNCSKAPWLSSFRPRPKTDHCSLIFPREKFSFSNIKTQNTFHHLLSLVGSHSVTGYRWMPVFYLIRLPGLYTIYG